MKKLIHVWISHYKSNGDPDHIQREHWTEHLGGAGVATNIMALQAELDSTFGVDRWFMWRPALSNGMQIIRRDVHPNLKYA